MAMNLPRGRATDSVAIVTFVAFLIVEMAQLTDRAAVIAGFIPARIGALAVHHIANAPPWLPVWLTPLTATLVHGGWLHAASNLLILVYCGRQVEHVLGAMRFLIIYAVGAYAAAFGQWAAAPASLDPMIGASGAISAILGTYALIYGQRQVAAIGPVPAQVVRMLWLAAGWTALQLLIGFAGLSLGPFGGIAIWAHIGGFIAGLLMARPMLAWRFGVKPY